MKKFLPYIIVALAVTGCIYPYDADVSKEINRIVIEGDILIGDTTDINISRVLSLNATNTSYGVVGEVWVEDDAGGRYNTFARVGNDFKINTCDASDALKYRLALNIMDPDTQVYNQYYSEWQAVRPAPTIDDLTFEAYEDYLYIYASMSSQDTSACYRWDYEENWKFHTKYRATIMWDPENEVYIEINGDPENYWCWDSYLSKESGLAIAESLKDGKLVKHFVRAISTNDVRIQTYYAFTMKLRSISKDCYTYLYNLQQNSNFSGSLFQTIPSDVPGNIYAESDGVEQPVGYIEATKVRMDRLFIGEGYYYAKQYTGDVFDATGRNPRSLYYNGYLPYNGDNLTNVYYWAPARCLDCIKAGGTKDIPEWWPEDQR